LWTNQRRAFFTPRQLRTFCSSRSPSRSLYDATACFLLHPAGPSRCKTVSFFLYIARPLPHFSLPAAQIFTMAARALYAALVSMWSLVGQAFVSVPGTRWEGDLLLQPPQPEWETNSGNWTHGSYMVEERSGSRESFLRDHVNFGLAAAAGLSYQSPPAHALFGELRRQAEAASAL